MNTIYKLRRENELGNTNGVYAALCRISQYVYEKLKISEVYITGGLG